MCRIQIGKRLLLFLAVLLFTANSWSLVRIYIDEPHYDLYYFDSVTLEVKIDGLNTDPLRGYQIHVEFDDTSLEVSGADAFREGTFLNEIGRTQWYVIPEGNGYNVTCSIMSVTNGAYGAGTLFTINLKAKDQSTGPAGTDVTLSDIVLRDPLNHGIVASTVDGSNIVIDALPLYAKAKVFLQGAYISGGTMRHSLQTAGYLPLVSPYNSAESVMALPVVTPRYIVDWVYLEVRSTSAGPSQQGRSCFLLDNGSVVDLEGDPILKIDYTAGYAYYLILRHRNHLALMSSVRHTFVANFSAATLYDLTALNSVYGGNYYGVQEVETGVLALCSGDADQSGSVLPTDSNLYWRLQTGLSGYYSADFNLDGNVLPSDKNLYWRTNSGKQTQIP